MKKYHFKEKRQILSEIYYSIGDFLMETAYDHALNTKNSQISILRKIIEIRPDGTVDINALFSAVHNRVYKYPLQEGACPWTSIGHILPSPIGGYTANYYSYLLANVIRQDFYQRYQERPQDYRRLVLEAGGEQKSNGVVKAFLGRKWKYEGFERKYLR